MQNHRDYVLEVIRGVHSKRSYHEIIRLGVI